MEEIVEKEETQTVGEMLRNARIKQNRTIEEVADDLCIRIFYLEAIENMDFENMPPMPYGLGFVRSYAKLLGLNSDRIVHMYRLVMNGEEEPKVSNENIRSETFAPRLKHFIIGIVGLAVLAIAWSVLPTNTKFEDVSEDTAVVVPEPTIVVEGEEIKDTEEKETEDSVKEEKTIGNAEKADEAKKNVADSVEEKVSEDSKKNEEEKSEEVVLPKMKLVLTGPSWLELRQDKKVLLNGVYNRGYKYDLPSEKGLVITVGRPRNVQFYLDGKLISVATNIKRKNISLDSYFKKQD